LSQFYLQENLNDLNELIVGLIKKAAYTARLYILGVSCEITFCDNDIYEQPVIDL